MKNKIFKNTMDYNLIIHNMNQQFSIFKKNALKLKLKNCNTFFF